MPEDIVVAEICKDFGWTYSQYLEQPNWFLAVIRAKMSVEGEYQKEQLKKQKQRGKH